MKIYRDDLIIELKKEEVQRAYREYLYEMDKEVLKSRLMDFIFDEFERIKDKETFYDEATIELRKNLSKCDSDLEDALGTAITSILFKYIDNCEQHKEEIKNVETERPIFDKDIKYFELYIDTEYAICLRAHRMPTKQELYTYLKTYENGAKSFDFSVEDIHGVQEITEDDAYFSYSMEYIDTLPCVN